MKNETGIISTSKKEEKRVYNSHRELCVAFQIKTSFLFV